MQPVIGSKIATVHLKKREDLRLQGGHLWVFSNELASVQHADEGTLLANCFSAAGEFLGSAFY